MRHVFSSMIIISWLGAITTISASEADQGTKLQPLTMRFDEAPATDSPDGYVAVRMLQLTDHAPAAPARESILAAKVESTALDGFGSVDATPTVPSQAFNVPATDRREEPDRGLDESDLDNDQPGFLQRAEQRLAGGRGWLQNDMRSLEQVARDRRPAAQQQAWDATRSMDDLMNPFDRRDRALSRPFDQPGLRFPGESLNDTSSRVGSRWADPSADLDRR